MQTRGDFVESLLNNAQELFFVDAVGWTTLAYQSLIDILNAFFLWCSVDVFYIWHLRRGRLASSLPWLAWEWLLLAHDIVHLHEVALCIILRLWPVDDARAMSVEVHLHLSESLFRHLDLCRHLKTLSELYERIVIKVNLGLLIYHFISTTGGILLLIWSVGIVGVTIIISLTRVTVWSTDQINFWVALDTWSTWDGCHNYARLSLNGLKGFDLRTIAARHSANRVILGLTFLGMGGRSRPAQTWGLFLSSLNLNLAAIQHSIFATSPYSSLCSTFSTSLFDFQPVRCQLILIINLLFSNLLCALFIRIKFSDLTILRKLLLAYIMCCPRFLHFLALFLWLLLAIGIILSHLLL